MANKAHQFEFQCFTNGFAPFPIHREGPGMGLNNNALPPAFYAAKSGEAAPQKRSALKLRSSEPTAA